MREAAPHAAGAFAEAAPGQSGGDESHDMDEADHEGEAEDGDDEMSAGERQDEPRAGHGSVAESAEGGDDAASTGQPESPARAASDRAPFSFFSWIRRESPAPQAADEEDNDKPDRRD